MHLFSRKPTSPTPLPPNELTQVLAGWIRRKKQRLAAVLSRREQKMSLRQKKWALCLFCILGTCFFLAELERNIASPQEASHNHWQNISLPVAITPPPPNASTSTRPAADTALTRQRIDSLH